MKIAFHELHEVKDAAVQDIILAVYQIEIPGTVEFRKFEHQNPLFLPEIPGSLFGDDRDSQPACHQILDGFLIVDTGSDAEVCLRDAQAFN